ncbi:MAG: SGNH/GDSL hydrolase family protein, partial [Candidatus Methylomirabilaceae bacterium]
MTRRRRERLSGALVVIVSLAASSLAAEIGIRVFLKRLVDTELLRARLDELSIRPLIRLTPDKETLYELKPGLSTKFRGSSVFTDAEGVRVSGREGSAPDSRKTSVRIAVLGDSTSFGFRIDYDDTYAEKLRRRLEAEAGVRLEMRNYSVPGYNAKQETRVFLDKVLDYKPDLVILHHDHNDAQATGMADPPDYLRPEYGDNPLRSALVKLALRQLGARRNPWVFRWDDSKNEYYGPYIVRGPLYDEHLASRQELVSHARTRG